MTLSASLRNSVLGLALLGLGMGMATAATHTPPPVSHPSVSSHHSYGGAHGGYGYHHHYYGYYAAWPWYFPWAYGYSGAYYGSSFLADAPVTYVEMAPAGAVTDGQPQPASAWYYCKNPEGYYPYIKACPAGWQTVPAQPPSQ